MRSEDIRHWGTAEILCRPRFFWETSQLGNCGSPLETEHGWLVITHGVGPVRRYTLGALLLDIDDPTQVVGRLREPLAEPEPPSSGNVLVPNVLYSCGAMVEGDWLILPYGFGDYGVEIGVGRLASIIAAMS